MKNYVKILLLVLLTAGTASFLLAQHPNVSKFFTTSNGLSDNSAICALRDRYGMLWVGTENGLNYFDGSRHHGLHILNTTTGQVTSLTYSANKPYTIPSNEVNSIYRTREGEIYVLTSWGLNRYDRATCHFYGYASISAMTSFICMEEASNGWQCASSGNRGLYCKRVKGGGFEQSISKALGKQTVVVLHQDIRGDLWAAIPALSQRHHQQHRL